MFDSVEIKEVKDTLGSLIRTVRKSRKISQVDMATKLDVSRNTIQNLESGKNFTIDTLLKVLKEMDLLDQVHREVLKVKKELTEVKSLY